MNIKILLASIIFGITPYSFAATLVFEQAGFQIDSLDAAPNASGSRPLMMLLPPENDFSANVNVQIQPYADSLSAYRKLSEAQFTQLGLKLIRAETKGNSVIFEYSGMMNNSNLHWYAKAIKKGDFVYLATATSPETHWKKHQAKLVSSINSFKLK